MKIRYTHHEALGSCDRQAFGVQASTQKHLDYLDIINDVCVALMGTISPPRRVHGLEQLAESGLPLVSRSAVLRKELLQPSREVVRIPRVNRVTCGDERTGINGAVCFFFFWPGHPSLPQRADYMSSAVIPALRRVTFLPTTPNAMILRVGDAWLVGVGKRALHGFRCLYLYLLMARWLGSKLMHYFPKWKCYY